MTHTDRIQTRIDAYLMQLRRSLGELPPEEVADILQEIRGHILERAEAAGELTDERLASILRALGRPEDIAPLYQAEAFMARARTSFSPTLLLRGALRWAMLSVKGFAIFVIALIGYGVALGFLAGGFGKMIAPSQIGAWVSPGSFSIGTSSSDVARDVLGWWLVPVGLIVGSLAIVATTRILRWSLAFAKVRMPLAREGALESGS